MPRKKKTAPKPTTELPKKEDHGTFCEAKQCVYFRTVKIPHLAFSCDFHDRIFAVRGRRPFDCGGPFKEKVKRRGWD